MDIPYVWKAVRLLLLDEGIDYEQSTLQQDFQLPAGHDWVAVNNFLSQLSEEDLEMLAIGEQSDQLRVAGAYGEYGMTVHRAIEDIWMELVGVDD